MNRVSQFRQTDFKSYFLDALTSAVFKCALAVQTCSYGFFRFVVEKKKKKNRF